jgi:5-methylcytosine-specific restriction endonuclease McrA
MNNLFEALRIRAIWNKGQIIPGEDPAIWRRDDFGNKIRFQNKSDRSSLYGWESDHIIPRATGGTDELANLRPLHWRANASLGGLLGNLLR